MAEGEVELENLIQKDYYNTSFSYELTNKYLCYISVNKDVFFEKQHQLVIAVIPEDSQNTKCSTLSLVLPTQDSQVILIPKDLVIKLHAGSEILENSNFLKEFIQIIFSQESFEAVELLLHQEIFSWSKFLTISIQFTRVLQFVLSEKLLEYGGFPFDSLENGNTLLHLCVYGNYCGSIKVILDLLGWKAFQSIKDVTKQDIQNFVDKTNSSDNTALQLCVLKHSHYCLLHLLEVGADIGIVDMNRNSIFHFASYFDDVKSIQIIFNYFESRDVASLILRDEMKRFNKQLLAPILLSKSIAVIDTFLGYIDLNVAFDDSGNLLIHLACKHNNVYLVNKLCCLSRDLNAINKDAKTPLKIAALQGNVKIVELLLDAGVSVGEKDDENAALFLAAEMGNIKIVSILIGYGASMYGRYSNVLHAASKGDNIELIEYLITEQKIEIDTMDINGESALFKSVMLGHKLSVKYLLMKGANPNQINCEKENMLILAIEHGEFEIVKILLAFKADASYVKPDGKTSLIIACENDRDDILSLIIDQITLESLNHCDNNGNSIGHIAVINDAWKCNHLLVECFSDQCTNDQIKQLLFKQRNNDGMSLYEVLFRNKGKDLKYLLFNAPIDYFFDNPEELHRMYDDGNYDLLVILLDRLVSEILLLIYYLIFGISICLQFLSKWLQVYENKSEFSRESMTIHWLHKHYRFSHMNSYYKVMRPYFFGFINWFDKKTLYVFPALFKHFYQFYNLLSIAAVSSGTIFIALRLTQDQNQWAFAALTFSLCSMFSLKYVSVLPNLGAYIASILQIFRSDIPKFLIVVFLILFSYIGSIHLAGRYEAQRRHPNDSVCLNDSSYIYWFNYEDSIGYTLKNPLISGTVFVLDGGPSDVQSSLLNLSFVYISIYLFFGFLVIIILLNILIAQLSLTYAEISAEREFHFIFQLVVYYELISTANLILGRYFRPRSVIKHIVLSKTEWRKYLNGSPSRSGDLLTRDIDVRSRNISDNVSLVQTVLSKMKSSLYTTSEIITHLYDNFVELRRDYFCEKLPRDVSTSVDVEQINKRLDVLEGKMERIIQLLENN
ncbi:Ankyrin repeat protein [Oopsacas minuta]|uniref:Ankyrin repeat protein n=1 Tax=Oopsacas minuta TaxID=111878 RepID=A0AAV7JTK5_9METZ|nr:Ankyrin repeat protein [Oopsacas minuta]